MMQNYSQRLFLVLDPVFSLLALSDSFPVVVDLIMTEKKKEMI